ncbi:MAG: glycosyltransferase family 39 protein, partial [Myxococcales bacterium]|nr:glycosyltransferase family 39 protein [Myxococcales bacterium]
MTVTPATARERWIVGGLVLVAVLLRLGHLAGAAQTLFFHNPIIDEQANVNVAIKVATGHGWSGDWEFWKPPLYSYFLGGVFAITGDVDLWLPRVLQALFDGVTVWLTWKVARRLVTARQALIAAGAVALHGTLIYFTGELTSSTLATLLYVASLALLLDAGERPRWWRWAVAGLMLGLSTLCRAETILVVPAALAFAAVRAGAGWPRRAVAAAVVTVGLLVAMSPATIYNYRARGELVLVSTNGGINFYVGTDPRYHGVIGARPGPQWEELSRIPPMLGYTTDTALSRYWSARARERIAADPLGYAVHVARKLGHFAHGYELPSNYDVYRARRTSPVLTALLWTTPVLQFPAGLIMPLALIGVVVAWRRRGVPLVAAFVGVQVVTAAIFFVTARFRAPVVPMLCVLAVAGGAWAYPRLRAWRDARRPAAIAAAVLVAVIVPLNLRAVLDGDRQAYRVALDAEAHHFRGTALLVAYDNRYVAALGELRRARDLVPSAATYLNEAKVLLLLARWDEALDALLAGAALADDDPAQSYLLRDYYTLMWQLGQAIQADPLALTPARRELVEAHGCWRWHDWTCAVPHLERALAGEPAGPGRA